MALAADVPATHNNKKAAAIRLEHWLGDLLFCPRPRAGEGAVGAARERPTVVQKKRKIQSQVDILCGAVFSNVSSCHRDRILKVKTPHLLHRPLPLPQGARAMDDGAPRG